MTFWLYAMVSMFDLSFVLIQNEIKCKTHFFLNNPCLILQIASTVPSYRINKKIECIIVLYANDKEWKSVDKLDFGILKSEENISVYMFTI